MELRREREREKEREMMMIYMTVCSLWITCPWLPSTLLNDKMINQNIS